MEYQEDMFGNPTRALASKQLVREKAKKYPTEKYTKEQWRRQVISDCLTDAPSFSHFADQLKNIALQQEGSFVAAMKAAFRTYLFDPATISTETINRDLRKYTEENELVFKRDNKRNEKTYHRAI